MSIADSLQAGDGLKEGQSHIGGNVGLVKKLNMRLNWIELNWYGFWGTVDDVGRKLQNSVMLSFEEERKKRAP